MISRKVNPRRRGRYNPYADENNVLFDAGLARDPGSPDYDPWERVRRALNVVSLDALGGNVGDRVVDPGSHLGDERVEAPDLTGAIAALEPIFRNALTEREGDVLLQYLMGDTFAEIARLYGLTDGSHAQKIVKRSLKELRKRMAHVPNIFKKAGDA